MATSEPSTPYWRTSVNGDSRQVSGLAQRTYSATQPPEQVSWDYEADFAAWQASNYPVPLLGVASGTTHTGRLWFHADTGKVELLQPKGWTLRPDAGNAYATALHAFAERGGPGKLLDRLLMAALIEARSCERLRLLEEGAAGWPGGRPQAWLDLLLELERCEAGHALAYRSLALERFGPAALARLEQWLEVEVEAIRACPWRSAVH